MPGVNSVQPRVQGGLLQQVLQGVQVARDIYGIKTDMSKSDAADAETAQREQATQQSAKTFEDTQAGIQPATQKVQALRYGTPATADTPGAIKQQFQGDADPTYMIPTRQQRSPLLAVAGAADPAGSGKYGTGFYDPSSPELGLQGWVETLAAPKSDTAKDHWSPAVLGTDGKMWTTNTATGEAKQVGGAGGVTFGKSAAPAIAAAAAADPDAPPDPKKVDKERKYIADIALKSGARNEVGKLKQKIDGAEALETLIANHPDFQVNPQLQTELAMGVANLVAPGTATQSMVEHMDPQTRGTFIANLMQKVTDEPYSANNPAFVKSFAETIAREKGTATDQLGRVVQQAQSAAPNFYKADKSGFLRLVGFKASDFDKDGNYINKVLGKAAEQPAAKPDSGMAVAAPAGAVVAPDAAAHPDAGAAAEWASFNRLSPDPVKAAKAQAILHRLEGK